MVANGRAQELIRNEAAPSPASGTAVVAQAGPDSGATVVQPYPSVDEVVLPSAPVTLQSGGNETTAEAAKNLGGKAWLPRFYLNTEVVYDSNIFIRPSMEQGDAAWEITPGMVMGWGAWQANLPAIGSFADERRVPVEEGEQERFIYFDYHPSFIFYNKYHSENAVNQDASLSASYRFGKLVTDADIHYQKLTGADFDTGNRENRTLLTGGVGVTYDVTEKTSYEMRFAVDSRAYQLYSGSTEIVNQNWLDYQYSPKTSLAVGLALGYLEYDAGYNQTYQQGLFRLGWLASAHFSVHSTVGVELRQNQSDGKNKIDSVFAQTVQYKPTDNTLLNFSASRSTYASASDSGQDVTYTDFHLNLKQTLYQRLYLTLAGDYVLADYQPATAGLAVQRTDNRYTFGLGVGVDFTENSGIQLAYTARRNDSNDPARSFTENIFSLQVSVLF